MKIECQREGLSTAFQVAQSVVPVRSPKPILSHVKLVVDDAGTATLLATDLDLSLRYRVSGVQANQPGEAMLPTVEMVSILRELSDERVEITADGTTVRVAGASSQFELLSEDPLQFPEVSDLEEEPLAKMKAADLSRMIRRTVFAAGENQRYALQSARLDFEEDGLARLVATDGMRMAIMPGPVELSGPMPEGVLLIPPKALQLLTKVLLDPEEPVGIAPRGNEVLFRTERFLLGSRLIDGRFPDYRSILPTEFRHEVAVPVDQFVTALRQASIMTTKDAKGVSFGFRQGEVTIRSQSVDKGQSEIRMPLAFQGSDLEITFDPMLLAEPLRVVGGEEEVTLNLNDERGAGVLKTGEGYTYILMPLTGGRRSES